MPDTFHKAYPFEATVEFSFSDSLLSAAMSAALEQVQMYFAAH